MLMVGPASTARVKKDLEVGSLKVELHLLLRYCLFLVPEKCFHCSSFYFFALFWS